MKQTGEKDEDDGSQYTKAKEYDISAAISEYLWSKFDAMVPQRRSGLSPTVIEALLYLKENRHLWSIANVKEALRRVKANEKAQRTAKKLAAHQEDEEMAADGAMRMGEVAEEVGPVNYSEGL